MKSSSSAIQLRDRPEFGASLEVLLSALYHRILKTGDVVIDGGANGGLHTIPLARIVGPEGRVFAFEPQTEPFESLRRWIRSEYLDNVVILRKSAIGSRRGSVPFYRNKTNDALSSLRIMDGKVEDWVPETAEMTRLDDILIPGRCSFVKLDLEGGEFDALIGAKSLVLRDRPIITLEHGYEWSARQFGYAPEDFLNYFKELDYSVWDFCNTKLEPASYLAQLMVWELIALPAESTLFPLIHRTIASFLDNYERVPVAKNWSEVMARIQSPFSTAYWP